jgi:ComF family protein
LRCAGGALVPAATDLREAAAVPSFPCVPDGSAMIGHCARAGRALLAFLLPDACLSCGDPLQDRERNLCPVCRGSLAARLRTVPLPGAVALYALPFDGPARALVHALKYEGRACAADELAAAVGPVIGPLVRGAVDAIVPVPLHAVRLRERGFNQAELIARRLAPFVGAPVETAWLRRVLPTRTQTDLPRRDRLANVRLAFAAGDGPAAGMRTLLVDDVVTTGATLTAAAAALERAGAACTRFAVAGTKPVDRKAAGPLSFRF